MDTMGLTLRRIPWDSAFSSMWKWTWICPVQVNYAEVFSLVQSIAEGTPCKLLERVAGKINEEILVRYSKVEEVATTVHKPSVPIHGILKDVSVTLHKKR